MLGRRKSVVLQRRPMRRRGVIAASVMAAILGAAAGASACVVPGGLTWYSDGTYLQSGAAGTVVVAYATGVAAGRSYRLVSDVIVHANRLCFEDPVVVNPQVRVSSESGLIGNTAGPVNRPVGTWELCFREINGGAAVSIPVYFTVV